MGRILTIITSTLFVAIGTWMIVDGDRTGWQVAGFFAACLLVAILDPWLPKPWLECDYRLEFTADELICTHPKRAREAVRWEDVQRIWFVTTSGGPYVPDEWLLFEGDHSGCSFPTEVKAMKQVWDELSQRFPGFDYGPMIRGGTVDAKHLCWERRASREA